MGTANEQVMVIDETEGKTMENNVPVNATTVEVINEQEVLGKNFRMYGTVDSPLFLAKDVAEWIDYAKRSNGTYDTSKMLKNVDEEEKVANIVRTPGGPQEMWFLTEDGLYEVLMQSRKPIAKAFKKQVKAILKEIRKTGQYIAKPMSELEILNRATAVMMEQQKQIEAIQAAQAESEKKFAMVNDRIDTLDGINVEGNNRQKLVRLLNYYAHEKGMPYPLAWKEFTGKFNTAYKMNLENRKTWYKKNLGLKNRPSTPEYLEAVGMIQDALRVVDKMIRPLSVA